MLKSSAIERLSEPFRNRRGDRLLVSLITRPMLQRNREKFGEGELKRIAAPESANTGRPVHKTPPLTLEFEMRGGITLVLGAPPCMAGGWSGSCFPLRGAGRLRHFDRMRISIVMFLQENICFPCSGKITRHSAGASDGAPGRNLLYRAFH